MSPKLDKLEEMPHEFVAGKLRKQDQKHQSLTKLLLRRWSKLPKKSSGTRGLRVSLLGGVLLRCYVASLRWEKFQRNFTAHVCRRHRHAIHRLRGTRLHATIRRLRDCSAPNGRRQSLESGRHHSSGRVPHRNLEHGHHRNLEHGHHHNSGPSVHHHTSAESQWAASY